MTTSASSNRTPARSSRGPPAASGSAAPGEGLEDLLTGGDPGIEGGVVEGEEELDVLLKRVAAALGDDLRKQVPAADQGFGGITLDI